MATVPLGAAKHKTEFAVVNCPWKAWTEQRAGRGTKVAEMYSGLSVFCPFSSASTHGTVGGAAENGSPSQIQYRFIVFLKSFGKYTFKMRTRIKLAPNNDINNRDSVPFLLGSVFALL